MSQAISFVVPLVPPSVNTYTRHSKGRHFKTAETEAFERAMATFCRGHRCVGEKFSVRLDVYFGPKQARDVDNLPKCVLDGIAKNGVLVNRKGEPLSDNHVDELTVRKWSTDRKNPRTEITVRALTGVTQ